MGREYFAGPPILGADIAQKSRVHARRHFDAGSWHWRKHGIFSVINGVLLRPLPYRDPGQLVAVQEQSLKTGDDFAFSYPDFLDCQRASQSFERLAAWRSSELNVTSPGEPESARAR
jgi:hypothetical protein